MGNTRLLLCRTWISTGIPVCGAQGKQPAKLVGDQWLVKIGSRLIKHARDYWLLLEAI